jgi:hypothetical protein
MLEVISIFIRCILVGRLISTPVSDNAEEFDFSSVSLAVLVYSAEFKVK